LNSPDWTNRIIFLNGFAGIGKTTFINHFINENKFKFRHYYFDINEYSIVREVDNEKKYLDNERTISECFRQFFIKQFDTHLISIKLFYIYLLRKKNTFHTYSVNLYSKINSLSPEYSFNNFTNLIDETDLESILILFFVYIFWLKEDQSRKYILYFDNLDEIQNDYLSEHFKEYFPKYLVTINKISRDSSFEFINFNFVSNYKFVFCLRDANHSQMHSKRTIQKSDYLWASIIGKPMKLYFDSDLYKNIIIKRLNFIAKVIPKEKLNETLYEQNQTRLFFTSILEDDEIFEKISLPLYNYDQRKLIINLYQIAENKNIIDKYFTKFYKEQQFGARGSILFGLIDYNMKKGFLKKFSKVFIPPDTPNGYCDARRLILTFLSNQSNYASYNHSNEYIKEIEIDFFDFIYSFRGIISVETLIKTITELFLDYQEGFTHFITISNKFVLNNSSFDSEVDLYKKIIELNTKYVEGDENSGIQMCELREKLNTIKIKINPAAFSFIRHVVIHFEYFSSISENNEPLFKPLQKIEVNGEMKFNFELKVEKVLLIVRRYFSLINKFYALRIKPQYAPEQYVTTKFVFKYFSDDNIARSNGMFYTLRVLTAHYSYLLKFRSWIISNNSDNHNLADEIDKIITNYLAEYNNLIKDDSDPKALDFYDTFKSEIDNLRKERKSKGLKYLKND